MGAVCILRLQGHLFAALEIPNVVDVQVARVGGEDEGLRRETVDEGRRIDAAIRAVGVSVAHVIFRACCTHGSSGTAILAVTWPVMQSATLTMPSVPAEYSDVPSTLYPSVRQLPLCRRVCQMLSMVPKPFSDAIVSSLSSSSLAPEGSLYVCTWPLAKPTAMIGSSGWIACTKMSCSTGSAHKFSNILGLKMMWELVECISRQLQLEFLWSRGSAVAGQVQPDGLGRYIHT